MRTGSLKSNMKNLAMINNNDKISVENFRKFLPDYNLICFDEIDSTNNYAKKLIRENNNPKNNTLIVADCQTAGRGRSGHSFISPSGTGVYMTLILNPVSNFQMVTIAAAVSVCLAIEKFNININKLPLIKWVNDIFMCNKKTKKSKKVCGILSEFVSGDNKNNNKNNKTEKIIVGIGLNVRPYNFSEDLKGVAGAIFDDENDNISRVEIASEIALNLTKFASRLDDIAIINNYRERMIFNTEFHSGNISYISDISDNKRRFGHVLNIDDNGGLIVKSRNADEIITLRSGEIFEIREDF